MLGRVVVLLSLAALIGVPLVARRGEVEPPRDAPQVIVITPHNEQIRAEFAWAFERWHQDRYGSPARVVYSTPGGTSEIRRMLESQYRADLRDDRPVGGTADIVWGGGSYEFTVMSSPITATGTPRQEGHEPTVTVLQPVRLPADLLERVYGSPTIGSDRLYDEAGYWFGTALSGFGIVFNRDVLHALDVPSPASWNDLTDPRLRTWVGLVNPAQSGSITTAFEAVLVRQGWERGWAILRRAAANSRGFAASASKVPIDVALGDAAAGICIDFYGRYESQAISDAGGGNRVGYIDPKGETRIDADPVAMLTGAPHPELARRFIEFLLSVDAQALWQLPPDGDAGPGPQRFTLRRMPVHRGLYNDPALLALFVDQVNPYEIASAVAEGDPVVRPFIAPLFGAMAMDAHDELVAAWNAIVDHPAYPRPTSGAMDPAQTSIITAEDVADPTLREMLRLFDAVPVVPTPDGAELALDTAEARRAIRNGWLRGAWGDARLWPPQASPADELRRRFREEFRENYRRIVELGGR